MCFYKAQGETFRVTQEIPQTKKMIKNSLNKHMWNLVCKNLKKRIGKTETYQFHF